MRWALLPALFVATWANGVVAGNNAEVVAEGEAEISMPMTVVQAQSLEDRVYDRKEMDATPAGNRDLASLVASHPAVRLNALEKNGNRGSLAPESISFHGESPYQNQFLIDGISGTNVVSPQEQALTGLTVGVVPGFAQAYNLDTELLDAVQVHDNRVPVEFGNFQGGVVDARIKTPEGSNRFSVKRSFNSSNLTQQQMPESLESKWEAGTPGYSAHWKKHFSSLQGDVRMSESSTALIAVSRRESQIERQSKLLDHTQTIPNAKNTLLESRAESDLADNLLAKMHTHWGTGVESNVVLKYANRKEDLVSNNFADTAWTHQQESKGLAFDMSQQLDIGKWSWSLGLDQMDAVRKSDATEFITQKFWSSSYGSYSYGGFSTESLEQRQWSSKLRMDWNTQQRGAVQHKAYVGLDLQHTEASFVRAQDVYSGIQQLQSNGTQKVEKRWLYRAGTVDATMNSLGLYASDSMQWGNWGVTLGVRADRDSFLKNLNIAPRGRIDWDVRGNGETQVGWGWSRYYGLNAMGYALLEGKSALQQALVLDSKIIDRAPELEAHRFAGLKTPHSDEWAFSVVQQLSPLMEAGFTYVRRSSKNGITQDERDGVVYYENGGLGQTETATVSLRTTKPWKAAGANWTVRADYSWQDTYRNQDLTAGWEAEGLSGNDRIIVDGKEMLRKDKPDSAFYQPRRISLGATGEWKQAGITWGNRINWLSSRSGIAFVGAPKPLYLDTYSSQKLPSYMTWDVSLTYRPAVLKGMTLNVDVLNVLNRQAPVANTSTITTNIQRYQTGREIWLNVAYDF